MPLRERIRPGAGNYRDAGRRLPTLGSQVAQRRRIGALPRSFSNEQFCSVFHFSPPFALFALLALGEKLAWRTSIVDLMKALNLDSSLNARKQLAKELNYTGDTNDSATMNVWLHLIMQSSNHCCFGDAGNQRWLDREDRLNLASNYLRSASIENRECVFSALAAE
jgi:hypothetical protein